LKANKNLALDGVFNKCQVPKRLARKTICFSKSEKMHDIAMALLINKVEFVIDIHA